mmetsp:Transcript_6697/g.15526  ORF Transcript_6697/g.15526 Transcript_6697/m.15526 type:complete len:276 (+) Transcript_6697:76-903(+)
MQRSRSGNRAKSEELHDKLTASISISNSKGSYQVQLKFKELCLQTQILDHVSSLISSCADTLQDFGFKDKAAQARSGLTGVEKFKESIIQEHLGLPAHRFGMVPEEAPLEEEELDEPGVASAGALGCSPGWDISPSSTSFGASPMPSSEDSFQTRGRPGSEDSARSTGRPTLEDSILEADNVMDSDEERLSKKAPVSTKMAFLRYFSQRLKAPPTTTRVKPMEDFHNVLGQSSERRQGQPQSQQSPAGRAPSTSGRPLAPAWSLRLPQNMREPNT